MKKRDKESWDREKKRKRNTEIEKQRKNGERREEKKGRKAKRDEEKDEWKNDLRKSDDRKRRKNVERKKVKQKSDWTETKNEGFWADFFVIKMWREKRINKEFQKEFENKRISHTLLHKNKRTEKEEKINGRKRKNRRCLLQFVGKKQHFSDTSKQESNKWETECWKEGRKRKKKES